MIIIGAGPAGLFTAINCAKNNKKVLVLEKNATAGKKLLLSGAGQCNITHSGDIDHFIEHYGDNGRFLRNALYEFSNKELIHFFEKRGLKLVESDEGKIFPNTFKALDVLNILLDECRKAKVEIIYNSNVKRVVHNEKDFGLETEDKHYSCRVVVVATGGKSYPNTGSSGEGYNFAKELGHKIVKPLPSLTPVYVKDYRFKELSGISFQSIPITLWRNNKKVRNTHGDILFTHKGISGPGILNFSRYIHKGDILKFNFLGVTDEVGFRKSFVKKLNSHGKSTVKTMLRDFDIPKRFTDKLLEISEIDEETSCAQLKKNERNLLIQLLLELPMEVEELGDYHVAMATRGGINLKEIQSKTMESRIVKGLYFVGEVTDIDGDTGGYNIQAAFSMGFLAAKSINGVI